MREPAIHVEGVGKRYRLGVHGGGGRLAERLEAAARAPVRWALRRTDTGTAHGDEPFWALRDISFEVPEGEVLGLIGPNGAGKSTMLKLLSRITRPTEGRITLRGRVATLLEVGTGFHPDLTGRENVFLSGTVLGMRRREIERQFDEIIEFSGIERFIDTPVKRYSSGMYVRLAFAVAAHLDPEILLVDEVLAVGDAEFQKKCVGKMQQVSRNEGRTIVFVSHNMASIRRICDRALLFERGHVHLDGSTDSVIAAYLERIEPTQHEGEAVVRPDAPHSGSGEAKLAKVALLDSGGRKTDRIRFGESYSVVLTFEAREPIEHTVVQIGVSNAEGTRILTAHNIDGGRPPMSFPAGTVEVTGEISSTLLPGEFALDVALLDPAGAQIDYLESVLRFTVLHTPVEGSDHYPFSTVRGSVRPVSEWSLGSATLSHPLGAAGRAQQSGGRRV
jgi:lipopolysaccharide transport system ATP-binding protein